MADRTTVFFGSPRSAVPTLRALVESDFELAAVVTQPPRGRIRGRSHIQTPIAEEATSLGLRVLAPDRVGEIVDLVRELRPYVGVIVAYGQIIPVELIEAFELGIVNLHFSLLPRWRGAAPVQRAILAGDSKTGVCTMLIDAGLDTGPIIDCVETEIGEDERAGELEARLSEIGAPLVVRSLAGLASGELKPKEQPSEGVTYAPALRRQECRLDWNEDAERLCRLVRAAHPNPCAFTSFRGKTLKVHRARVSAVAYSTEDRTVKKNGDRSKPPGSVVATGPDSLVVLCGKGALEILEVQLEGRRVMTAAEFARGARISPEERLGEYDS